MSNYPPGVTGNEFAIAGPDYERESDDRCPYCESEMVELGYRNERWLTCLDNDHQIDLEPFSKPDPDRAYDEARERRLFGD